MSKHATRAIGNVVDTVFPGAGTVGRKASDASLALITPKLPGVADMSDPNVDPRIAQRATVDFATREQSIQKAAAAAGAQRSENEADLLGYTVPKSRAARRTLLGGR